MQLSKQRTRKILPLCRTRRGRYTMKITSPLKAGIKLPKSAQQWKAAEDHFREALPLREISPNCLNENIEQMNRSLCDYFVRKFGKENDRCPSELAERYKDKTKNDLKRILKTLKNSPPENIDTNEIKYVAKLLRQKIKDNAENQVPFSTTEDHNILVQKNVWSYAKKFIKKPSSYQHFQKLIASNTSKRPSVSLIPENSLGYLITYQNSISRLSNLT